MAERVADAGRERSGNVANKPPSTTTREGENDKRKDGIVPLATHFRPERWRESVTFARSYVPYLSPLLFSFQIFPANSWNTEGKFVANRIMDLSELESLALDKKMERMERRRSKKKCFGSEIVIRMG